MALSEKGMVRGSTGEWTAVASANRGVLGGLARDDEVDELSVDVPELADMVLTGWRFRACGRFLSSWGAMATTLDGGVFVLCYWGVYRWATDNERNGRDQSSQWLYIIGYSRGDRAAGPLQAWLGSRMGTFGEGMVI
jgi:hypothetical protein